MLAWFRSVDISISRLPALLILIPLELVLAPGVPDSAASLSYPYTNELINSLLKIHVYDTVGDEDPHSFPAPRESRGSDADCDFRKRLHVSTGLADINYAYSHLLWGCESQARSFPGMKIEYISRSGFHKFNITEFRLVNSLSLIYDILISILNFKDGQTAGAGKYSPTTSPELGIQIQVSLPQKKISERC